MTNPLPVLSDDEVREITTKKYLHTGQRDVNVAMEEARGDIDALCATVWALRASDEHNYQLWLDLKERHKHKFASADGKWSDTCQQCGVTIGDDHDGYDCIAWLQRTNTALREQLAELRTHLRQQRETIKFWQRHTARMGKLLGTVGMDSEVEAAVKQLQSQLAQVTQERNRYADALESATKGIKCDD